MPISSPGIGSGLDVRSIVDQLVELERQPLARLQERQSKLGTQLSSFGLMQSYMANLQSAASVLTRADTWTRNTASSANAAAVAATASASAVPGTYSIEVLGLAAAQSLSTAAGAITDSSNLGAGTLTITHGSTPVAIAVADGTSLSQLRDQINAADAHVRASIVQDSGGPRLVLTATETGVAHAVTVGVTGATGQLAALAYPGAMSQDRPAADASFRVNGLLLSNASNRLTGVLDGVSLTLGQVTTGAVQVSVASDAAAMRKAIGDFVSAYNDINRFVAAETRYDESTKTAGKLQGDSTALGLQSRLRGLLQQSSTASTVHRTLSSLGMQMQRDGSIKIDESALSDALADPQEVAQAFTAAGVGFGVRFKALGDAALGTQGLLPTRVTGLQGSIRRSEQEQRRLEERIARTEARLLRQYSALDNSLNQLTGLGNYVQQQIASWNRQGDDN